MEKKSILDRINFFQPKSDKNKDEEKLKKWKNWDIKHKKEIQEKEQKIEEIKKQKEEEEKKKLKEQKEKNKIIQENLEEEKRKKLEEKKKQKEEEEQKQKEREKTRQEYQKKREEEEREKIQKEQEKKKKLEEELQRKKEIEKQNFADFQIELEKQERQRIEEKAKKLLEQEKELTELLKRQNIARNEPKEEIETEIDKIVENYNIQEEKQKQKLYQTLEDMCKLGNIIKNQIIEEKEQNKENETKFISIEEAFEQPEKLKSNETDQKIKNDAEGLFCLGILAQNLEENGIMTAIEKNRNNSQEFSSASLQFLVNGLIDKPRYDFTFEFGEERNNELLNNKNEQKIFNDKLRKKLSIEYNIPEDKIIITCPERGSYKVKVIFMTDEFNKDFSKEKFINSCTQEEFKELCNLKDIQKGVIMEGVKLDLSMLDSRGNQHPNNYGGGKRGGEEYIPPMGWTGYGLNVMNKYDNGNNDWLAMNGNANEWAVAYHGIGKAGNTKDTEKITNLIIKGGFKAGVGQSRQNDDDVRHPPNGKVGVGVYCTPDIKIAEGYAGSSSIINGKRYKMVFMMRVKPDRIRSSKNSPKEWILDGTTNEMRPYRILLKEI